MEEILWVIKIHCDIKNLKLTNQQYFISWRDSIAFLQDFECFMDTWYTWHKNY